LDATVIRMFLVPSVMKLLGDDCWWAPMWMKRLQNRIGLGEIHLPDERKKPVPRARAERPAVVERPPVAAQPRPPHDPTHPGAEAPPRPSRPAGPAPRPEFRPPAQDTPSAAGTTKMRAPGRPEPKEPPTTRFPAPQNAAPSPAPGRPPTPGTPPPRGEEREIESWLSELRGPQSNDRPAGPRGPHQTSPPPPSKPSADQTRAMPVPTERPAGQRPDNEGVEDQATTAIPTPPREDKDPDVATQKLNARGKDVEGSDRTRQRRGGGLSAADLLRREGRI
jgi:trehalose monomycolate/heme transporter